MRRLDALGLIRIVRHRKGHVSRCIMHKRPGDPEPVKPSDYLGTRYSFREHLDNGHLCWRLKRLGRGKELRPIFLAVVADFLQRAFLSLGDRVLCIAIASSVLWLRKLCTGSGL